MEQGWMSSYLAILEYLFIPMALFGCTENILYGEKKHFYISFVCLILYDNS